jgi:hypothetical protein
MKWYFTDGLLPWLGQLIVNISVKLTIRELISAGSLTAWCQMTLSLFFFTFFYISGAPIKL